MAWFAKRLAKVSVCFAFSFHLGIFQPEIISP